MEILDKRNKIGIAVVVLLLACDYLAFNYVWAGDGRNGKSDAFVPGFSGKINPGVGFMSSKSLDSVGDENKKIDSLDQAAESETEVVPMIFWNLQYVFDNQSTSIFAGSSSDSPAGGFSMLEAGVRQKLPDGTVLTAAYIPDFWGEVWEDPFKLGSNRVKVDQDTQSFRIAAESILGSGFDIKYGYASIDIEDEQSGSYLLDQRLLTVGGLESLERSGDIQALELSYSLGFGHGGMIQPGLNYRLGDIDGEANAYNEYGASVSISHPIGPFRFFGTLSAGLVEYDEHNPVFNDTREDTIYSAMVGAGIQQPFGWENIGFNLRAGYKAQESNIAYYDESAVMLGLGMSWRF